MDSRVTRPAGPDVEKIRGPTRRLLGWGEDPDREDLLNTALRVAKAMAFLTSGYRVDPAELINGAIFTQQANSMVIGKDIEL